MQGMLLQEYVADMLEVRIPEGWEESVKIAHSQDPDDEDTAVDMEDVENDSSRRSESEFDTDDEEQEDEDGSKDESE
jgi:hypothetical protein